MALRVRHSCFLFAIVALSRPVAAVELDHQPVACVLADVNPRIVTKATPDEDVARIRFYFRSDEKGGYYSLGATRVSEGLFATVLPQPKAGAEFEYYMEAFDVSFQSTKTPVAKVRAVRAPAECQGLVAETAPATDLVLSVPAGRKVSKVPGGFSGAGIVRAGEEHIGMFNLSTGQALLAGAGVLGAGVGVSLATSGKPTPVNEAAQTQFPPNLSLSSSTPRNGGEVRASVPMVAVSLAITSPVAIVAPVVHLDFYRDVAGASELCAMLERPGSNRVNQNSPSLLFVSGPLTFTGACGQPPHPMRQLRITVRDGDVVVLNTGGVFPDDQINYSVVP
jgi:hypothetical protein